MPAPRTLAEIIQTGTQAHMDEVHVCMPARVVDYDPVTATATVQPTVKRAVYDSAGERSYETLPQICLVPIMFPRGGGFVLTLPIATGDTVWLVFSENAYGEYLSTGQDSEPVDATRHGLSYPIAFPGGFPDPQALSPTDLSARSAGVVLGQDGTDNQIRMDGSVIKLGASATDFVALASLVLARLNDIKTTFDSHTHAFASVSGPALTSAPASAPAGVPAIVIPTPASVAASSVKAK